MKSDSNVRLRLLVSGACVACAWSSAALADEPSFEVETAAGARYDSNVSVDQIDLSLNQGDYAATFDAGAQLEIDLAENTEFGARYSFGQTLYSEFPEFDIQTHLASTQLSHEFGPVEVGAAYRYVNSYLDGESFLEMHQGEPFISVRFGDVLLRGAYTYKDKTFEGRPERDATANAAGADLYYFVNGVETYFVVGYDYEDEDAQADYYDFEGHGFKARFSQRFPFIGREGKFSLGGRHETRDFVGVHPSIGAPREDRRTRLEVELELPLSDRLFVAAEYEYADFSSNLASADYQQHLGEVRLGVRF